MSKKILKTNAQVQLLQTKNTEISQSNQLQIELLGGLCLSHHTPETCLHFPAAPRMRGAEEGWASDSRLRNDVRAAFIRCVASFR